MWSPFSPQPCPSLISIAMARATTSRPARSWTDEKTPYSSNALLFSDKYACQEELGDICKPLHLESRLNWRDRKKKIGIMVSIPMFIIGGSCVVFADPSTNVESMTHMNPCLVHQDPNTGPSGRASEQPASQSRSAGITLDLAQDCATHAVNSV